jgi:hypothetical protein
LLYKVFHENKKLNLELESVFSEIASLRSVHDDMSTKPYDNCTMIMINYADLWLLHSRVASLLDGASLELRELKACSTLLDDCTTCPLLRSDLEILAVEIKDLKHRLDHASRYTILTPLCIVCGSLKGKLFYATKENTELKQEVAYLTAYLEKTVLNVKMIEDDLSRVDDSATKSTYKLGIGFERCEDKGEKNAPKFIPSSTYHQEEKTIKSTKVHYPSNPKPSFNPKKEVRKETPKPREEAFVCIFCGCAGHLNEFCFCALIILETHIVISFFIFRLALSLMLHLALLLMLCLMSLIDLTIAHMVLVHERIALCLDALDMAHVLIVVIVSHVGMIFLPELLTLTLSPDIWTVHIFPIMVHVPLGQVVRC